MTLQMLSEEQARLNFPRPASPPQRLAPAQPTDQGSAALSPGGRAWLARMTSGSIGSGQPDHHRFRDPVLTLVHRISMGFQHAEYERARTLGFQAYLEEQLDAFTIDDAFTDNKLDYFPVLQQSPKEVFD